jgi:hypothetical protein
MVEREGRLEVMGDGGGGYKERCRVELAGRLNAILEARSEIVAEEPSPPSDSLKVVRALLRSGLPNLAEGIFEKELGDKDISDPAYAGEIVQAIHSLASYHYSADSYDKARFHVQSLTAAGPEVRKLVDSNAPGFDGFTVDWTKLVLSASKCESRRRSQLKNCLSNGGSVASLLSTLGGPRNVVYEVLNAMTTFPASNSDETYEALANALVRRVHFVKGAVEMGGCPKGDRGEVAFIGRCNVGKSR